MFNVVVELILAYVQFLSVPLEAKTTSDSSDYPSEWSDPMYYLSFLNLNLNIIGDIITTISDIRIYFLVLAVSVPIVMVFFGLFFLSKKRVVIWYFFTVLFFMTLVVGAFAKAITASKVVALNSRSAEIMMYVGVGGLIMCWLLFLCGYKGLCGKISEDDEKQVSRREVREKETARCSGQAFAERFVTFLVIVVGASVIIIFESTIDNATLNYFAMGLAGFLYCLGCIVMIWIFMGFFKCGRAAQWSVNEYFRQTFLKLLLLLMSTLYIPIGTTVFTIFNCNSFTCPAGYRLPDDGSVILLNSSIYSGNCVPCTFSTYSNGTCPSSVLSTGCAGYTEDRLEYNVAVECSRMKTFYWPAGILIIIMYLIGVPLVFFQLIRASGAMLYKDFPIKEPTIQPEEKEADFQNRRWLTKVRSSNNSVLFLFQPFEFKFRYARLFQLLQKLVVVGTSVYVFRDSLVSPRIIAVGTSLGVHTLATLLFIVSTPFIILLHDIIALGMSFVLSLATLVAILVLCGVNVPSGVLIAVIVVCIATPVAAFFTGLAAWIYNCRSERELAEAEAQHRVKTLAEVEAGLDGRRASRRNRFITSRVKVELDRENEQLRDAQHDFDVHIDNRVQKQLRIFLMVGGVLGILAFGCCFLGLWNATNFSVVVASERAETVSQQFGGYSLWANFTDSCCCTSNDNGYSNLAKLNFDGTEYVTVEKWICANGVVVERPRSVYLNNGSAYVASATAVRDVCSPTFAPGCSLSETDPNALSISCSFSLTSTEKRLW